MKINFSTPAKLFTFQGVKCTGSTNKNDEDFYNKYTEQHDRTFKLANELKQQGKDVFVIALCNEDARGNVRDEIKSYVLYDEEAQIPQQYDKISKDLVRLFQGDLASDLFTKRLNDKLDEINTQQNSIAEFIAENRSYIEE